MTVSPPASLRGSTVGPLKSRRGCKTCKIRKVKCGEEKPHCIRCTSTGRKCEYQGQVAGTFSSASSTVSILDTILSSLPNAVWRERRAFAYYFQHAAPFVGGELDIDFWRNIVPQICRVEPAVWDAIISISALFESPEPCPDLVFLRQKDFHVLNQNHRDALGWYSRSVSAVSRRIERGDVDMFVGLISCVLFICIEGLQGGVEEAFRLYGQGVYLIRALRAQITCGALSATKASLLEDVIVPVFVRLGEIAIALSSDLMHLLTESTSNAMTQGFINLRSAREAIVLLIAEAQVLERSFEAHQLESGTSELPVELTNKQAALSVRLSSWKTAFGNLVNLLRNRDIISPQEMSMIALLFAHYDTLFVTIGICLSTMQSLTDSYLPNFQRIVEQCRIALEASARSDGSQPPFTFDISVGLPLWFTSLRCREPRIRRAALTLLRQAPHVQGFYRCVSGAAFGEKVMMVEERYAMAMHAAEGRSNFMIPESAKEFISRGILSNVSGFDLDHPTFTEVKSGMPLSVLIPEEARVGPVSMFRGRDGFPPGTPDDDIVKGNQSPDQTFLSFSRNKFDKASNSWKRVHGSIPIEVITT
ncbi:C6 zinc finger domain protein [Aspergillus ellipticus CBS 707.79]|uniref:C6 zinc finger domain protein n=1 Tax=Aspergillus ellipticus CBS 707.79 TaxID=1448320 RepID=A0A319DQG2_9EURO|nr:C6 zinc finger domain protein [Aspergillus ellipticus CBS 707.79]